MTPLSCFTLRSDSSARAAPKGTLLHQGRDIGLHLDATALEAQFLVEPGLYLLFLTDNCPHEEELQILLMDQHLRLLDGLRLGQWYTPGLLSDIHPKDEHQLTFEFFPDTRLSLRIHPEGKFHLIRSLPPFARPFKGRLLSKHYLSIESAQAPTQE